eukprot:SAG22_NODE_639_length_8255_cov_13.659882_9_plen_135_part_00
MLPGAKGSRLDVVVNFSLPDHAAGATLFGSGGGSVGFGVMCDEDESLPVAQACAANATFVVDGYGRGSVAIGTTSSVNATEALRGDRNSSRSCGGGGGGRRPCPRLALPANGLISLRLLVDGSSLCVRQPASNY